MKIEEVKSNSLVDTDKVSQCLSKIIETISESHLVVAELILLYGNLGYSLGASIEGKAQSPDDLQRAYYANPTVGVSMMLTGLTCCSWYDSYIQSIEKQEKIQ